MTISEWADRYLAKGWSVVPLRKGTKRATQHGWLDLAFTADDFEADDNLGLRSINGLAFVDVDCAEAVACADTYLPPTPCVYGRPSKPRRKRIYRAPFDKILAFKDKDTATTLVEIRVQHQDMAPPSVHPDGEVLGWDADPGEPPTVEAEALTRAVKLLASASLIARHYAARGSRHDWCLALAGMLRRRDISEAECRTLLTTAAVWAHDDKVADRLTEIGSTYAHADDDPITGGTALTQIATGKLVESLTALWGNAAVTSIYALNTRHQPDRNSTANITLALDKMAVGLRYDLFAKKPYITYNGYRGLLDDAVSTDLWLDCDAQEHFRPTKDLFFDVLGHRARQDAYHPVTTYLDALSWDGTPRLDSWLIESAGAEDTPYTRAVSALVLIAAVRRVRVPGSKFDEMLVLESAEQGVFKSTALQALCPISEWFSDDLPLNVSSKEIVERTAGKWLIEASEISGMRAAQIEGLKGMLSRQVDGPVRMAYGRLPVEVPRQFILIGTTNSYTYLSDQTGNRRFWPVRIAAFRIDWITAHRDHLWAEAAHREAVGDSIRLDPALYTAAATQQQSRMYDHPWAEALSEEYGGQRGTMRIKPDDLWTFLAVPVERRTALGSRILAQAMQGLGFRRISIRSEADTVVRGWGRDT